MTVVVINDVDLRHKSFRRAFPHDAMGDFHNIGRHCVVLLKKGNSSTDETRNLADILASLVLELETANKVDDRMDTVFVGQKD